MEDTLGCLGLQRVFKHELTWSEDSTAKRIESRSNKWRLLRSKTDLLWIISVHVWNSWQRERNWTPALLENCDWTEEKNIFEWFYIHCESAKVQMNISQWGYGEIWVKFVVNSGEEKATTLIFLKQNTAYPSKPHLYLYIYTHISHIIIEAQ